MTRIQKAVSDPIANLAIGTIIEVDGTHIVAELDSEIAELTRVYNGVTYPIGQFGSIVKIHFGRRIVYAYVSRLRMKSDFERELGLQITAHPTARVIEADLFGEADCISTSGTWTIRFERGVQTFPLPQQRVYLTPRSELASIYGRGNEHSIAVGEHVGAGGAPCYLDMDELLGKHTAILGSTGAGKSGAVAAILHAVIDHGPANKYGEWNPRIVILDPHNEYASAFPNHTRLSSDERTLNLPYWMLDLEETIQLIIGKSEHGASAQTQVLKNALLAARSLGARTLNLDPANYTVDSPIPYEIGNPSGLDNLGQRDQVLDTNGLVGQINDLRPKDSKDKSKHEEFNKLIRKIDSLMRDGRLQFMMTPWVANPDNDLLTQVMGQFLVGDNPITIIDLSGVPNEVAGAASSAIARTLFAAKLWQSAEERQDSPVLLVCEEAHRYVPNRGEAQYAAARDAIQRLAKEGRKYGIGLMLVSQRPSEVDATVLSQCNSWVVLRITNESDREHVRSVLPDSLTGLTKVLSGLRQREAIIVGQATSLPSRILIRKLTDDRLPKSHDISFNQGWQHMRIEDSQLSELADRWRRQVRKSNLVTPQTSDADNRVKAE